MKKLVFAVLALVVLSLAACSTITIPDDITDNPVGTKTGESNAILLGPFMLSGDISLATAAKNGGVTRIATVEQRLEAKLGGLWCKLTTIVTGN
jgi:hypothetical protein